MKKLILAIFPFAILMIVISACDHKKADETPPAETTYKPDSQELYDEIVKQDSIFFAAYNKCDTLTQAAYFANDLEFYHDKGGLDTSKARIMEAIKNNICGKVTRILVKGSIEVYPINNYGAVEIGFHRFHNNQEKENSLSRPGKFVITWHQKGDKWEITRVISLH